MKVKVPLSLKWERFRRDMKIFVCGILTGHKKKLFPSSKICNRCGCYIGDDI